MRTSNRERSRSDLVGQEANGHQESQGGLGVGGSPERRTGERSEADRSGGEPPTPNAGPQGSSRQVRPPDPEVSTKAKRRRFTAEYKLKVLREADRCKQPGEIGALLRREGLYSSHITAWRKERAQGEMRGLTPKRRGRKRDPDEAQRRKLESLRRENSQLQRRLKKAETIIEVQKKVSELLGIPLNTPDSDESDS